MASSDFKKIHSEKRNKVRDLNDVRTRASKRVKENRKSNREAVLNLHRQVENIPEVSKKKTQQEEKLSRLKTYRNEKLKRMEEQKKNQKPPFYSLVRTRHTGGTPFRSTQPLKKPVFSLPPVTRSKTAFQKEFEFKATLHDLKEQSGSLQKIIFQRKTAAIKSTINKENLPARNNFKIVDREPVVKNNVKQKPVVPPKIGVSRSTRIKENQSDKNNVVIKSNILGAQRGKIEVKPKTDSSVKRAIKKGKKNAKNLSSVENKIQESSELLANRLAEQVFIMSPLAASTTVKRSTRRRPRPSTGSDIVCETKSKDGTEESNVSNLERHEKSVEESNSVKPEALRKKLNEETIRLNRIAEMWSKRHKEEHILEDVKDEILAVVGQTRLLVSDKFKQFGSLIDNALSTHDESSVVIKSDDLLGFWEMMYLEVEKLNRRYQNLDNLKNNECLPSEKVTVMNKSKKKINARNPTTTRSSKFREFLEKKKEGKNNSEKMDISAIQDTPFKKTPSLMRTLSSEYRTRRSSASSITLQKCFLAKAVLSPLKKS